MTGQLTPDLTADLGGTAAAQGRPERPYRGLFASGLGAADHSLVATGSVGSGWDNNLLADTRFAVEVEFGTIEQAVADTETAAPSELVITGHAGK